LQRLVAESGDTVETERTAQRLASNRDPTREELLAFLAEIPYVDEVDEFGCDEVVFWLNDWHSDTRRYARPSEKAHNRIQTSHAPRSRVLLVQSDVNTPQLFLRNPDWHIMFDIDPIQAAVTRHKFYDMAAAEKPLIAGCHFLFPSLGHVEKDGTGYRLIPIAGNAPFLR
jgi:hypothetical protein